MALLADSGSGCHEVTVGMVASCNSHLKVCCSWRSSKRGLTWCWFVWLWFFPIWVSLLAASLLSHRGGWALSRWAMQERNGGGLLNAFYGLVSEVTQQLLYHELLVRSKLQSAAHTQEGQAPLPSKRSVKNRGHVLNVQFHTFIKFWPQSNTVGTITHSPVTDEGTQG